jgi:hypothetical protein
MIAVNSCSCVPVLRHAKNRAAPEIFPPARNALVAHIEAAGRSVNARRADTR